MPYVIVRQPYYPDYSEVVAWRPTLDEAQRYVADPPPPPRCERARPPHYYIVELCPDGTVREHEHEHPRG